MTTSNNLLATLRICQELTIDDLLSLAISIGEKKAEIKNREEWATAIAMVIERRAPKNNLSQLN